MASQCNSLVRECEELLKEPRYAIIKYATRGSKPPISDIYTELYSCQWLASATPSPGLLIKMDEKIQTIKRAALQLKEISGGIQAVDRNADRILTSTKMLEINVSDVLEPGSGRPGLFPRGWHRRCAESSHPIAGW
jgi:hypothetical protein